MAVITTSVTPEIRHTQFTGLSETERERSAIARGETIHFSNGIWAAAGAGNNRGLIFTIDLDKNFAYVLTDLSCVFLAAANGNIAAEASALVEFAIPSQNGTEYIYVPMTAPAGRQDSSATTPVGDMPARAYNTLYPTGTDVGSMCFNLDRPPNYLFYPWYQDGTNNVSCLTMFGEQVANYTSMSYRFAARFLQYDITQAYNYPLNSPVMTR